MYSEAAEIHFSYLAGNKSDNFRGGLLRELRASSDTPAVARRIALDLVTSASASIAVSKVQLVRAAVALEESEEHRRSLLEEVRVAAEEVGHPPALPFTAFARAFRFESVAAVRRAELPVEVRGTNAMMPNRPLTGWEERMQMAAGEILDDLSAAGHLFVDRLTGGRALRVAMKLDLNMGIDGAPSVSDPALTGAVLFELLERAFARGVRLHFTVGDSCGIENASVGRTSMDVMLETGNYHHAIKAALRFVLRRDEDASKREAASRLLNEMATLEGATPPVYLRDDRAAAVARPWVECVDYDDTGFVRIVSEANPLVQAAWGTREFDIARPWVEADHRVHVTRGCSTHLFAGWTGALKGLIGLHALGKRPADQGMNERGETALDFLVWMMNQTGFETIFARKGGLKESVVQGKLWPELKTRADLTNGWRVWLDRTKALERELRRELRDGVDETSVMAKMRRSIRAILIEADRAAPGFRAALWQPSRKELVWA